jgi:hypothetical protein
MGGQNGGAAITDERKMMGEDNSAREQALGAIDSAELSNQEQIAEAEKNRQFSKSEREGSQKFAKEERQQSQGYASKEAAAGRQTAKDTQAYQIFNANKMASRDRKYQMGIAKMQNALGQQTLDWQKQVDQFNMDMAEAMANKKDTFGRLGDFATKGYKKGAGGYNAHKDARSSGDIVTLSNPVAGVW